MANRQGSRARDNQRKRLYTAENEAIRGRELPSVEEISRYLTEIGLSRWFRSRWGPYLDVEVRDGRGYRIATAYPRFRSAGSVTGLLQMPRWSRFERIVLHELAHLLVPGNYAWHGPEFAGVLLALVRQYMGEEAWKSLRTCYQLRRVRYNSKAIPKAGSFPVAPKERAAKPPPTNIASRYDAANTIRRAAKEGLFGAAGSKARMHALATARKLEAAE